MTVTKEPVQEQLFVIRHLMCAVVAKLYSIALLSHVHSPDVPTSLGQDASMNSVKGAAARQGFSCGIERSLISVELIFKAGHH